MTRYQLRWDDSRTAHVRREGAGDLRPLAWLRVSYAGSSHELGRADVYTHTEQLRSRLWRGTVESVGAAVAFYEAHKVIWRPRPPARAFPTVWPDHPCIRRRRPRLFTAAESVKLKTGGRTSGRGGLRVSA
jgi:hypothetical protein